MWCRGFWWRWVIQRSCRITGQIRGPRVVWEAGDTSPRWRALLPGTGVCDLQFYQQSVDHIRVSRLSDEWSKVWHEGVSRCAPTTLPPWLLRPLVPAWGCRASGVPQGQIYKPAGCRPEGQRGLQQAFAAWGPAAATVGCTAISHLLAAVDFGVLRMRGTEGERPERNASSRGTSGHSVAWVTARDSTSRSRDTTLAHVDTFLVNLTKWEDWNTNGMRSWRTCTLVSMLNEYVSSCLCT